MSSWKVLRVSDKYSNAAGSAAAGLAICGGANGNEETDEETDEPSSGGRSAAQLGGAALPLAGRTTGNKAARRGRIAEAVASREAKDSIDAVRALTRAAEERTANIFFSTPAMNDTNETKPFFSAKAKRMLASIGASAGGPAGGSASADTTEEGSPPAAAAVAPPAARARRGKNVYQVVDDDDNEEEGLMKTSSPRPAARRPPPRAPASIDDVARPLPVRAVAPSRRPPRGPLGRGAKAQLTKAAAASYRLRQSLPYAFPLDHDSDCGSGSSASYGRGRTPRLSDESSSESGDEVFD